MVTARGVLEEARCIDSEQEMLALGGEFARSIQAGVIYLQGELGVGKTTIVRGWLNELGHVGVVASPTYTLVEQYDVNGKGVVHLDLYRIDDPKELEYVGIEELIDAADLTLIEWPEKGADYFVQPNVTLTISYGKAGRQVEVRHA